MALYRFVEPQMSASRLDALRTELLRECQQAGILGTLLLAPEGINGTVTGTPQALEALRVWLTQQPEFADLTVKLSAARAAVPAFLRMKVKIKDEIVSFGQAVAPAQSTGEHVDAARWNELLADPQTVVIDTRNSYEIEVGTFPGAIDPGTTNFREFPEFVAQRLDPATQPQIAMFCTGGIRCEKASAYLLQQGFEHVYQLDGGVLNYLETVGDSESELENRWQGECFVFDQRVALDADLQPGDYLQCHACRRPVAPEEVEHPDYVEGVSCARCVGETNAQKRAGFAERQRQVELAGQRGTQHIGPESQSS